MQEVPPAPDVRPPWRQAAAAPWSAFRRLPWWGQVLGWLLGFWILPALWLAARAGGPAGMVGAAIAAILGLIIVAPLATGPTDDPSTRDAEAVATATPTPTSTPSPAPTSTPSPVSTSTPSVDPTSIPSASASSPPAPATPTNLPTPSPPAPSGLPDGVPMVVDRIVDGDTLYLTGLAERARLIGIDTPETVAPNSPVECLGPEATAHLTELVPPGTDVVVTFDVELVDRFDRPLVYLYRVEDGLFVNEAMLADGFALLATFPPNVAHVETFRAAEREAREAGVGLWSTACD